MKSAWTHHMPVHAIEGALYAVFKDDGNEQDFEVDIWSIDCAGNVSESARYLRRGRMG